MLPLSPYRPLQFTTIVPCATLQALNARPDGGEVLRTLPAEMVTAPGEGLVVAAAQGIATVTAFSAELAREPLPTGDCSYRVLADAGAVRVTRDGETSATGAPACDAEDQNLDLITTAQSVETAHLEWAWQSRTGMKCLGALHSVATPHDLDHLRLRIRVTGFEEYGTCSAAVGAWASHPFGKRL